MSDALSTFVTGMQTALAASLPSYAFSPGEPPSAFSAPPSAAVGFVWCLGLETDSANQLQELIHGMVRLYPVQAEQFDGGTPIDPTAALYPDAAAAQASLKGVQVPSGGDPWFLTVWQVQVNHQQQYAELAVTGTRWNDGTAGS